MDSWMGWVIIGLSALNLLLLLGLVWVVKAKLATALNLPQALTGAKSPLAKGATRATEDPKKKPDDSVILMTLDRDERILAADGD